MTTPMLRQVTAVACEDELLDLKTVCRRIGGTKPINAATLYRGIRAGRYPAPIKISPNASRWLRSECDAVLNAIIARRATQ